MQNEPTATVIIPVWNTAPWVGKLISRIENQTLQNWECFLVDDGSTDGSGAVCDEAARRDARFRVIHQPNSGVSAARNAALEKARGRWVFFFDSDDQVSTRLLEEAVRLKTRQPEAMVTWSRTIREEEFLAADSRPLTHTSSTRQALSFRDELFGLVTQRVFDLAFIRQKGLAFDEKLGEPGHVYEDGDFYTRYVNSRWPGGDFPVLIIDQPLYYYNQENENSIMHRHSRLEARQNVQPETDPLQPEAGYWQKAIRDGQAALSTLRVEEDPPGARHFARHFLRALAFGIYSARALGEELPRGLYRDPFVKELFRICKAARLYSPYCVLMRLHATRFIARFYVWDEEKSIWYWRFYEIFYRLFYRGYEK